MTPNILYKFASVFAGLAALLAVIAIVRIAIPDDGAKIDAERVHLAGETADNGAQPHQISTAVKPSKTGITTVSTGQTEQTSAKISQPTTNQAAEKAAVKDDHKSDIIAEELAKTATEVAPPSAPVDKTAKTPFVKPEAPRTGHHPELEKKLIEVLKPLTTKTLSNNDKKNTKKALDLIRRDKFSAAKEIYKKIKDTDCRELVLWYGMRSKWEKLSYKEIEAYRKAHLDWPDASRLRGQSEAVLYRRKAPADEVLAFFKDKAPISGPGMTSLASALLTKGEKEKAAEIIRNAWRTKDLTKTTQREVIKKFSKLLTKEDHRARVDRFLFRGKRKHVASALLAAKYLSAAERKKIDARVAVIRRSGKAARLIKALSTEAKKDPGVIHARMLWAAKRKKHTQIHELLRNAPETIEASVPIDGWWRELRGHVRRALDDRKYEAAYAMAKRHGPLTVNYHNDAKFMSGWIALRYLKKPELAKPHFAAFIKSADGPRTRGKSNYWMGQTLLAMGKKDEAHSFFKKSGEEFGTYYGQLSRQILNGTSEHFDIPPPPEPEQNTITRFMKMAPVKAVVIAHLVERQDLENKLLTHLRYHFNDAEELVLLAELAQQLDNTQHAVRIGKRGMFLKLNLAHYAYPTHAIPEFKPLRSLPERAFIFAIARQESEFNTKIKSHAGARGLMQVMPATARHIAKNYKIKYSRAKLTSDPAYNAKLGSSYIADWLDGFNGNYIMTIAGYNAGPGRVRQWVKKFGDPRKSSVDPINWVERIPFVETRNYVLKVMSNIQVYRARLGKPKNALRMAQDLYRARSDEPDGLMYATN